jgi:Mrp family chromosome partitioning ATPase
LALAASGSDLKSLMFVSAVPGEGVSTITLGFAVAALEGTSQGILVVDADFGRPDLAGRLGVTPKAGIAEVLAKEVALADAIQPTMVQRLSFLGLGRRPMDLARSRGLLEELLNELRATFDYVVIDGGAIQARSESLLFASRVDGVALVVRAERTGSELARGAAIHLRGAGANLLGTILNRRREYLPSFLAKRL